MFFRLKDVYFSNDSHDEELDDAPDIPPTRSVSLIVIMSFVFIFVCIALSFPITRKLAEYKEAKMITGMGNKERIVYISNQKEIMSSYKKNDDGSYQIPIQEAMKIVVKNQGDMTNYEK